MLIYSGSVSRQISITGVVSTSILMCIRSVLMTGQQAENALPAMHNLQPEPGSTCIGFSSMTSLLAHFREK